MLYSSVTSPWHTAWFWPLSYHISLIFLLPFWLILFRLFWGWFLFYSKEYLSFTHALNVTVLQDSAQDFFIPYLTHWTKTFHLQSWFLLHSHLLNLHLQHTILCSWHTWSILLDILNISNRFSNMDFIFWNFLLLWWSHSALPSARAKEESQLLQWLLLPYHHPVNPQSLLMLALTDFSKSLISL